MSHKLPLQFMQTVMQISERVDFPRHISLLKLTTEPLDYIVGISCDHLTKQGVGEPF